MARHCLDIWLQRKVMAPSVLQPLVKRLQERSKGDGPEVVPLAATRRVTKGERAEGDPLGQTEGMVANEYGT